VKAQFGSVLDALLEASGPMTVESLALQCRLPPGRVLQEIQSLRSDGCVIDSHPQRGLRMVRSGLGCWGAWLEPRHAGRIGRKISVYRQLASTQDAGRRIARCADSHDGHVIVADEQTRGRGRLGRRWLAAPGTGILMTAIVATSDDPGRSVDRLMLASCCAVAQALESIAGTSVQVRWPNDVLVEGRKIAGILVETVDRAALIGIGVNVAAHEADLPAGVAATSLRLIGSWTDRLKVLDVLLDRLHTTLYDASDSPAADLCGVRRAEDHRAGCGHRSPPRSAAGRR
jgi:BirA family transcriptional regulator, biotin operon repressor / biotin---[acetyl-CoA-carboxylase] ligase